MVEILVSAQDRNDYDMQRSVLESMPRVGVYEATVDRALDIQAAMARVGTHRSACVPDLLIAACAQMNGLTVLHYDSDYDTIAAVTGQPTEWVVPAGTA